MKRRKMPKRQLTSEERRLTEKSVEMLKEELEYKEKVRLPRMQLTLDTADLEVRRQIKEEEKKKKYVLAEIEEHKNAIEELEKQLKYGVEKKSKK